jgi:hypothetical protein
MGDVCLLPDGSADVGSQTEPLKVYRVQGRECPCQDHQAPEGWCKHALAARLYTSARKITTAGVAQEPGPAPEGIDPRWIVAIQNRPHVRFAGLLALAHERGLVGIRVEVVSVSDTCAVMQATAVFEDGRTWTEIGDATPKNVNSRIAPHFVRMAATRAKARCLRDALNLADLLSVEELEE